MTKIAIYRYKDLFNGEPVVRTIVECATPVVVAVGHEDDETLAERVADERAMTRTSSSSHSSDVAPLRVEYDAFVSCLLYGLTQPIDEL
jgi:hypothetical protein